MKDRGAQQVIAASCALAAALFLVGRTGDTRATAPASSRMPTAAEQACLRDVTRETNNADVVLLSSSFAEAGTEVIVGVGPQRARWRCIAYRDGSTAGIMSLADEGAL